MQTIARKKTSDGYNRLRARLLHRGMTLRGFALARGHSVPFVYDAASGRRRGPTAKKIRAQLEDLANE